MNSKNFAIQKRVTEGQMFIFARGENSATRGPKISILNEIMKTDA